ncbi:MAG: conjugative transposon protein TraM [Bacteroidota bacterium]
MDKNKKIIAISIFVVFMVLIGVYVKMALFASDEEETTEDEKISLSTPKVDEGQIESITKKESYDREVHTKFDPKNELIERDEYQEDTAEGYNFNPFKRQERREVASGSAQQFGANEQQKAEEELMLLMKMQEEMDAVAQEKVNTTYGPPSPAPARPAKVSNALEEEPEPAPPTLKDRWQESNENKSNFNGLGGFSPEIDGFPLVPAETVDQRLLIAGSTVAIRLKQSIYLPEQDIRIPKGALLYGKASFSADNRMQIDIESYKTNEKLHSVTLAIYDFDGREGIHLGNNNWPKIPSKVSKEVYRFVKQRNNQNSTFGGQDNEVEPDEIRRVALLATINEVTQELFDRKRVLMPRKYHLWIHVATKNDVK